MYTSELGEYNGHPVLTVSEDGKRVVTVGKRKAQALLACVEDLREFVGNTGESHDGNRQG